MKTTLILILLFTSSFLYGGLKIPRYAYNIKNLDEAKSEAKEQAKFLAFVYTDPNST